VDPCGFIGSCYHQDYGSTLCWETVWMGRVKRECERIAPGHGGCLLAELMADVLRRHLHYARAEWPSRQPTQEHVNSLCNGLSASSASMSGATFSVKIVTGCSLALTLLHSSYARESPTPMRSCLDIRRIQHVQTPSASNNSSTSPAPKSVPRDCPLQYGKWRGDRGLSTLSPARLHFV
jgi:hypothetical protein